MILKELTESKELLVMRYLNARMELTEKEKSQYLNLEKGFIGEMKFDQMAKSLEEERYIINDLLLEVNNSFFQIDKFIISQGIIHLLDIKNFLGDFYLDSNKFYSKTTGREYKNPVDQLKRSVTLFRQLLQKHKLNYLVEPSVIFINPEFTLYQAPLDLPIILPTQVNRFLHNLNKTPSTLSDGHRKLAQTLLSLHQTKNPHSIIPDYSYGKIKKGNFCIDCKSSNFSINKHYLVCKNCGRIEKVEDAILRNIVEFSLLFPDLKITTQVIFDWCQLELNKKTFSRVLNRNYTKFGVTSNTFYNKF